MASQALGLAEAVGFPYLEKLLTVRFPWDCLPSEFWLMPLRAVRNKGELLRPPWPDLGKNRYRIAESLGREIGVIAADHPGLFESAHPAQAGRRRDADTPGQLDIGHPPIAQQVPQYAAVDTVESDSPHPVPSSSIGGS